MIAAGNSRSVRKQILPGRMGMNSMGKSVETHIIFLFDSAIDFGSARCEGFVRSIQHFTPLATKIELSDSFCADSDLKPEWISSP